MAAKMEALFDMEDPSSNAKGVPVAQTPAYIRSGFVRKVYSILAAQLLLTVLIATPFHLYVTQEFVATHMSLYYLSLGATLGLVVGMACCCEQAARTFPTNYALLFALTALESVMVGFVVSLYKTESVLIAALATALTFTALSLFAVVTKHDFTGYGIYLVGATSALLSLSFVIWICSMFLPIPQGVQMLYAGIGLVIFSCYVIYDTQMIVGGSHKVQFSVDDYCFAALNLYLDIINIFLYLLSLFGERE